jgi:hypothetical protein
MSNSVKRSNITRKEINKKKDKRLKIETMVNT